jgi:acyl carrier protein
MSSSDSSSPTFNSIATILETDFRVERSAISPATASAKDTVSRTTC